MQIKVAVVQESPVFFDKNATLQKMAELVETCAENGAQLIVFPESFVPGYPRGFDFGAVVGSRTPEGRDLFEEYARNSIDLGGADRQALEAMAQKSGCYIVAGVTERTNTNGTLYCSMLYLSPSRGLLGVHRKIKPTGTERVIWGEAGGESLVGFDTALGKMGGLICWENYMPLARVAMYQLGVEIYIAPTADARENWVTTLTHIALEGRCFVLGCNQFFTREMYPPRLRSTVRSGPDRFCRGGSVIISPLGEHLAGPLFDEPGVLYAELDLAEVQRAKLDLDVVGHYARDDIFNLEVIGQPKLIKE